MYSDADISLNVKVTLTPWSTGTSHNPTKAHKLTFNQNSTVSDIKEEIQQRHPVFRVGDVLEKNQSLLPHMEIFLGDFDSTLNNPSSPQHLAQSNAPHQICNKGIWLKDDKSLDYYLLRENATIIYQDVRRILVVRMLDNSRKSIEVNDSFTVNQMMETICKKVGLVNFDEYSLAREGFWEYVYHDGTHTKLRSDSSSTRCWLSVITNVCKV